MREKSIVVASRAGGGTGDMPDARFPRMRGDESSQIYRPTIAWCFAGELSIHLGTHLIAITADCRTQVNAELAGGKPALGEGFDPTLDDPSRRASPAGMEQCGGAGWMSNEDGDAVRHTNGESKTAIRRDVSVRGIDAQPASPIAAVHDHVGPMNLGRAG
jgi:hypothetical protein